LKNVIILFTFDKPTNIVSLLEIKIVGA